MWLTNKSQSKQKAITYPSEVIDFPYSHTKCCSVRNLCLQPAPGNPDSWDLKLKGILNCSRIKHRQEHGWEWDMQEPHVDWSNPVKRPANERGLNPLLLSQWESEPWLQRPLGRGLIWNNMPRHWMLRLWFYVAICSRSARLFLRC